MLQALLKQLCRGRRKREREWEEEAKGRGKQEDEREIAKGFGGKWWVKGGSSEWKEKERNREAGESSCKRNCVAEKFYPG